MKKANSYTGYVPDDINYCPKCGGDDIYFDDTAGRLYCRDCSIECYLIDVDDSYFEEKIEG